jgi:protein-L-isoaspartate(D-aspartate) O-methyltransferase
MSDTQAGIGMTSLRTRLRMVERLRADGIRDEVVLAAMAEVPRHLFVDEALASRAYDDDALPIGYGQTISSPYVVARICELARANRRLGRVLDVGTGCGYQAAVLAQFSTEVYSIERLALLLRRARANLRAARVRNVRVRHADGYIGLQDLAPFDAIAIGAAAPEIPSALVDQLSDAGHLVLPLGSEHQRLILIERRGDLLQQTQFDSVRFVPLLPGVAA